MAGAAGGVACTCLLPLCGANGAALVPCLLLWLGGAAVLALREGRRGPALIALAGTLGATALLGFYFVGYERPAHHDWPAPGVPGTIGTAIHVLAAGLGGRVARLEPLPGLVVLALLGMAGWALRRALSIPTERARSLSLGLWLCGLLCLALLIGHGRGGRAWQGAAAYHYAPVALLLPGLCYVLTECFGGAAQWRWRRPGFLALGGAIFVLNVSMLQGWPGGALAALERDIRSGLPAEEVVERHVHVLLHEDTQWGRKWVTRQIAGLRRARVGPFRIEP